MKKHKILIIILVLVVLVSGCAQEPKKPVSNRTEVNQTSIPTIDSETYFNSKAFDIPRKQGQIFDYLISVGINDSLVDITEERVLVRYNLPENIEKEKTYYFVFGIVSKIHPESKKIQIETYKNFESFEEVSVDMQSVLDFVNKRISFEEFEKKVI